VSPDQLEVLVEQLEEQLPAASYDTVGIGWSADDDGPLVATAYHFDSEDVAEESTDALRELYESGTSVQSRRPFSDYLKGEGDRRLRRRGASRPAEDAALNFANQALISRDLLFVRR